MKLTDEKKAELVREALKVLSRGGTFTRAECFGPNDDKPFKNWTRKVMVKFTVWGLVTSLPQEKEGDPTRFQVKDFAAIERIMKDPEEIADLLWGDGPKKPGPFIPPSVGLMPVSAQPDVKPDLPGEKPPESTGPQPFVPPTSSTEQLTTEDVMQALGESLSVLKQMGDLLIWMKGQMQTQGKKINEMHSILEQLK